MMLMIQVKEVMYSEIAVKISGTGGSVITTPPRI